jgi:hypothetical protein
VRMVTLTSDGCRVRDNKGLAVDQTTSVSQGIFSRVLLGLRRYAMATLTSYIGEIEAKCSLHSFSSCVISSLGWCGGPCLVQLAAPAYLANWTSSKRHPLGYTNPIVNSNSSTRLT